MTNVALRARARTRPDRIRLRHHTFARGLAALVAGCALAHSAIANDKVTLSSQVNTHGRASHSTFVVEPQDLQFYPREKSSIMRQTPSSGHAVVAIHGLIEDLGGGDITARVWKDGVTPVDYTQPVDSSLNTPQSFGLSFPLDAGVAEYTITTFYRERTPQQEYPASPIVLSRADRVVVGDAFLVVGQSNAFAQSLEQPSGNFSVQGCMPTDPAVGHVIRSFGLRNTNEHPGHRNATMSQLAMDDTNWYEAHDDNPDHGGFVGIWPLDLAHSIAAAEGIAVAIINGSRGETILENQGLLTIPNGISIKTYYFAHQRDNYDPESFNSIYGQLLRRVSRAGLQKCIRGLFWYQGESERGRVICPTPLGLMEYLRGQYAHPLEELMGGWNTDYIGLEHVFVFQVLTSPDDSDPTARVTSPNTLRHVQETQRTSADIAFGQSWSFDVTAIPVAGIRHDSVYNLHFNCTEHEKIADRAYAALTSALADYQPAPTVFDPVDPLFAQHTATTTDGGTIEVVLDASIVDPLERGWTLADVLSRFDLTDAAGNAYTITSTGSVDSVGGTITFDYINSGPNLRPFYVTYKVDRVDAAILEATNDMGVFGFTIKVLP